MSCCVGAVFVCLCVCVCVCVVVSAYSSACLLSLWTECLHVESDTTLDAERAPVATVAAVTETVAAAVAAAVDAASLKNNKVSVCVRIRSVFVCCIMYVCGLCVYLFVCCMVYVCGLCVFVICVLHVCM